MCPSSYSAILEEIGHLISLSRVCHTIDNSIEDLQSSGIYCCVQNLIFDIKEIVSYTLSSLMDIHETHIQKCC